MKKEQDHETNPDQFLIVGIGASAGGIKSLKEFFTLMPDDSGMVFVVILHLSEEHESNLAEILNRQTSMPVQQVNSTIKMEPNNVYVIPPAKHLELKDGEIHLKKPKRVRGVRVPIDRFFRSMAETYGQKAICIILSGTGRDGTLGIKHIKGKNGFAIVQDPFDAEYDEMPRSAIETKIADVILPVAEMPEKLLFVRDSTQRLLLDHDQNGEFGKEKKNIVMLRDVLTLLRIRTGHDFANYKRSTIIRRITRHLQIHETDNLKEYLEILREKPDEVLSLLKNLLINVTNFFRDKEAFISLEKKVIPSLFEGKKPEDSVRVWIAGCASGEEAYSIAILLTEYASTLPNPPKIQIFASDVDEEAIDEAREGLFTETIVADISPERLKNFFIKEEEGYRIRKSIRELILFSPHNILRDPPFSRLDLVSCRNVLIYLNRNTQEKVLRFFHFALRGNGYLFLGTSESAEGLINEFSAIDKKHRIYQSRPTSGGWNISQQLPETNVWMKKFPNLPLSARQNLQSYGELHQHLIEQFAPPSILVNEAGDILHLSENAGKYLRFVGGEPTVNLLKVIHPDLLSDVRAALFAARQEHNSFESKNIRVKIDNTEKPINLIIRPVKTPDTAVLVIFEEIENQVNNKDSMQEIVANDHALETVIRQMENDLQRTRDQLRTTIEQYETSVEELKASNEELQAMNEELRSATEELETSKEELQSVNEELTTVNLELKEKVDEVSQVNSDLQNLMQSTDIATIFLDRRLNVKRYTPTTREIFNLIPSDVGRPLDHITHHLEFNQFKEIASKVLKNLQPLEREIVSNKGKYFLTRFTPYRTLEDKIDGVVIAFIDITERKQTEKALHESEEKYRFGLESEVIQRTAELAESREQYLSLVENTPDVITRWDNNLKLIYANNAFESKTGVSNQSLYGKTFQEMGEFDEIAQSFTESLKKVFQTGEAVEHFNSFPTPTGDIYFYSRIVPEKNKQGKIQTVLAIARDITELRDAEEELLKVKDELAQNTEKKYRNLFETIDEGFAIIELVRDEKRQVIDLIYREVNEAFEHHSGFKDVVNKSVFELTPNYNLDRLKLIKWVSETGESTRTENYVEDNDRWYRVHIAPVGGANSSFISVVFEDISERKRRERQQEYLLKFSDALRSLTNAEEIQDIATRVLGENLNVSRAYYYTTEKDGENYVYVTNKDYYRDPGMPSLIGKYPESAFGEKLFKDLSKGKTLIVQDVNKHPNIKPEEIERYLAIDVISFVVVPLIKNENYIGGFVALHSKPKKWSTEEIAIVEETAERTWAAVERALAEEALRESESILRALGENLPGGAAFVINQDLHYLLAVGEAIRDAGFNTEDFLGKSIYEALPTELAEEYEIYYRRALKGESFVYEHSSHNRTFLTRGAPLFDQNGKIYAALAVSYDISERKASEAKTVASEARYRALVEASAQTVWSLDANSNNYLPLDWFSQITGKSPEDFQDQKYLEFIHPFDREYLQKVWRKISKTPIPYEIEFGLLNENGNYRQYNLRGVPLFKPDGTLREWIGTATDVTDKKEAASILKRYRMLLEKASDIVWLLRPNGDIIEINQAAVDTYGYTREELLQMNISQIREPSTLLALPEDLEQTTKSGKKFETLHIRKDGSVIPVEINANGADFGGERLIMGIVRDITERKKAEKQTADDLKSMTILQRLGVQTTQQNKTLEEILSEVVESAINITDSDKGNLQLFHPETDTLRIAASRGYDKDFLHYFGIMDKNNTAACTVSLNTLEQVFIPDICTHPIFTDNPALDILLAENIRSVESTPLISSTGQVLGMISTHSTQTNKFSDRELRLMKLIARLSADFIERKQNEIAIRKQTALLNSVNNNTTELIFMKDLQGRLTYCNSATLTSLGLTMEEAIGSDNTARFSNKDEAAEIDANDQKVIETGKTITVEEEYTNADGRLRIYLSTKSPMFDEFGNISGVIGVSRDITDRKNAERKIETANYRFRVAEEAVKGFNYDWNLENGKVSRSSSIERVTGFNRKEFAQTWRAWTKIINPEDFKIKTETEAIKFINSFKSETFGTEYRVRHKNGQEIWVMERGLIIRNEKGKAIRVIGQITDINEHKQAEEALRLKDELLTQITDVTPTMLVRCSRDFRYLFVNNTASYFLGFSPREIIGKPIVEIMGEKAFAIILPFIKKVLKGERVEFETEVPLQAGHRFMHVVYVPEWDKNGEVIGWFATVTDISQRKRSEEANAFLASIIQSSDDAVISKDLNGKITSWNKSAEKMFGYKASEIIGKSITLLIPKKFGKEEELILSKLRRGNPIQHYETIRQRKDGSLIEVSLTISPIQDTNGNIIGASKIVRDITERKKAEEALQKSEERYSLATKAVQAVIYDWNIVSDKIIRSNQLVNLLGFSSEDQLTQTHKWWKTRLHPDDAKRAINFVQDQINSKSERFEDEYRVQHRDGHYVWVSDIGILFRDKKGKAIRCVGSVANISARKSAEENLRQSEEFHSIISDISTDWAFSAQIQPGGIVITDAITKGFTKQLGYTLEELKTQGWDSIVHPEDLPHTAEQMKKLMKGEIIRGEVRYLTKGGHIIVSQYQTSPKINEKGRVVRVYGATKDITAQKLSEQIVRESAERLKNVIESATEYAIFTLTLNGIIDSWSSGAEKVFGYQEKEIIGQHFETLFTDKNRQKGAALMEMDSVLKYGRATDDRYHLRKDGTKFFASGIMMPLLKNNKTVGFVKITRDMTQQIAAEKAMRDKETLQKLVGALENERHRIARDLHDELGQQLIVLRLKLENTRRICKDPLIRDELDKILMVTKGLDDGIDFLAWELRPAVLDDLGLFAALEKYVNEWSQHSGISGELLPSSTKGLRLTNEIETNLYRIAQEALNNISKHSKATNAEIQLERRNDKIVLIIVDNGIGFNPKVKRNRSKGIGLLGMKERTSIIGGILEIESAPGRGTSIFVRVPVSFNEEEVKINE
ncbi:MAG: PAS domain S-box protein [Pyrinomonadaceae bacterium]|nr:PAS domain S-box protein [Pyrinomonadaceae bacterium]